MTFKTPITAFIGLVLLVSCAATDKPDLSGMRFSDTPLSGKVIWHDLITEDLDAASRFYEGLFGWTIEESGKKNGNRYFLARQDGVYVGGLLEVASRSDGHRISRWLPYVSVTDVDSAVARAKAAGAQIIVAPRDIGFGRVAAITDPEGAVIGLARSDVGDPADPATVAAPGTATWHELPSNDTAKATAFYETVFTYRPAQTERRGGQYIMLHASGRERAGILANPAAEWKPDWLTYFAVADPAAAAARAESLGGKIILPVSPERREGTIAVVTDPAGAVLVLQKALR